MKLFPTLCLAALTLFASCSDKTGSSADPNEGSVANGKYRNEALDMTLPVPKDWIVRPQPKEDAAPGAGEKAMEMKRKKRLLFACLDKNNCNNSMLVVLQPASAARGGTDPEKYRQHLIDREDEQNRQYLITGHYTKGTAEYGGQKFHTLHVRRQNKNTQFQKLEQDYLFRFIGDQVLTITLNYEEERFKKVLVQSLENAEFGK